MSSNTSSSSKNNDSKSMSVSQKSITNALRKSGAETGDYIVSVTKKGSRMEKIVGLGLGLDLMCSISNMN